MFHNPSLFTRIAIGKGIGFIFGLIGFMTLPYFFPEADLMLRWGMLLWYTTLGAIVGVFGVINSHTVETATRWIHFSEIVTCFLPPTLYHFIGYFPKGRFDGSTKLLATLYGLAFLLSLNSLTPNFIYDVVVSAGDVPQASHHKAS